LPHLVTFEQGAALGIPYHTAFRGLFQKARACKGETVLIHGASGGVGIAAVQFAKAAGMKVIASAGTVEGQKVTARQGANLTVDHDDSDHMQKVIDFTRGKGVDVVLEMLANANLGRDLPVLAKNGRVVIIGSRGSVEIDPRDLMTKEASILGLMSNLAEHEQKQQAFKAIETGLEKGALKPVVGQTYSLADASQAHYEILVSSHHGKILLIP
jgi:NADPH2:quinone reductase